MKINLRRVTTGAVLIAAASAFLFCTGFTKASDHGNHENGYLKSATYYSDDWVINFWNSESSHMDEELKQIREDGFNSIILGGNFSHLWRRNTIMTTHGRSLTG